mgnify:CR=1 FL=1
MGSARKPESAKYLTTEQLEKLLAATAKLPAPTGLYRLAFELCARAGFRVVELLWFKVGDIDWVEGRAMIVTAKRRGVGRKLKRDQRPGQVPEHRKRYLVMFPPDLLNRLLNWVTLQKLTEEDHVLRWGGWHPTKGTIQRAFKQAAKLAGLHPRVSIHALRHTYATNVARLLKDPYQVQELLRHASIQSSVVYVHRSDEERRRAVDKL